MIDSLAAHILELPPWVALAVVFLLPALESAAFVGFVFPGEIALILGGVLASQSRLSLVAVLGAGIAGAIVGDSVGYAVGRRYGRRLLEGTLGRFVNHRHFDRAESYLADRGGSAVFLGRFTAALRVMIPGLAGMSHLPYRRFLVFNVAGGAAWGTMSVLVGYLGGASWRSAAHLTSRIGLGALVVVAVVLAMAWTLRRARGRWSVAGQRVLDSAPVRAFDTRFPRTSASLAARLDPDTPRGLALTGLVALMIASVWVFLGVTQDVLAHDGLGVLDPRVHVWILAHRSGPVTVVMKTATFLGSNVVVIPALLVLGLVLGRRRRSWRPLAAAVVVYGLGQVVHAVVGTLVHRLRPPSADWLTAASGWSYPSGHTIQAALVGGLLAVLLTARRSGTVRVGVAVSTAVYAVLVAASRVYLGVHWLTDVIGSLAAATALLCGWLVTRRTVTHRLGR
ncbi:MAG: VTT domain-containing protein [Nocardioides sp.]